jgi:hypothetical protein
VLLLLLLLLLLPSSLCRCVFGRAERRNYEQLAHSAA